MPWTIDDPPPPAKNWDAESKRKCVEAANAVLEEQDGSEEDAIFACIRAAGKSEQSSNMQFIANQIQPAEVQRVNRHGREWLVVPVVMLSESEQVLNGELVRLNEAGAVPEAWDGVPVTLGHPKRAGRFVGAGDLDILEKESVGLLRNTSRNGKLKSEMWIDVDKAEQLGGDALTAVQNFEDGEVIDVSTGYFRTLQRQRGERGGQRYDGIARNIIPNHLAILLHEAGACSVEDGCGAPRANEGSDMRINLRKTARTPKFSDTTSSDWSAPDWEDFISAWSGEAEGSPSVSDAPQGLKDFAAAHSLLGDPQADTFRELVFFPVVDPSSGNLNENALGAVISGRGAQADIAAGAKSSAQNKARSLLNEEFDRELETKSSIVNAIKCGFREAIQAYEGSGGMTEEERQAIIDGLVANEEAGWEVEDFEGMDDAVLERIAAMAEETEAEESETEESIDDTEQDDDVPAWVQELTERLDEIEGQLTANERQEKQELIERVKASSLSPFEDGDEDVLAAMTVNQLETLTGKLVKPNYAGAAGATVNTGGGQVTLAQATRRMGAGGSD